MKRDGLFLLVCIGLGIAAEISFFHGRVGIAYPLFMSAFYLVFFYRFRLTLTHQRIGWLLFGCLMLLSGSYALYEKTLFVELNLLVILVGSFVHIVLTTSPEAMRWETPAFVRLLSVKFGSGIKYIFTFLGGAFQLTFKNMNEQTARTVKRILLGLCIGFPIFLVILALLMSADRAFENIVMRLPSMLFTLDIGESVFRTLVILFFSLLFFGVFQVLKKETKIGDADEEKDEIEWDPTIAGTILILLNGVYVLFVAIQFTYFFNDGLMQGYSYAEYARKGFFELIVVTLINWTLLITFLKFIKVEKRAVKLFLQLMYSLLIATSTIMLISAYQRLSLYEEMYGFTIDRILAHSFMLFLMVIFAYTLIKVWIERLSLIHFYVIAGLLFYTVLNVIHVEKIIADNNWERYEQSERIDIHYLSYLGDAGLDTLVKLYEKDPTYPELKDMLQAKKEQLETERNRWQSYRLLHDKETESLRKLRLE